VEEKVVEALVTRFIAGRAGPARQSGGMAPLHRWWSYSVKKKKKNGWLTNGPG
jgi:hypothetical protein